MTTRKLATKTARTSYSKPKSRPSRKPKAAKMIKLPAVNKNADKAHLFLTRWIQLAPAGSPIPVSEYPFSQVVKRKHRADFAFPADKLLIEVDGGKYAVGGGRHAGDKDKEKLNLANELGYRVLRYSPQMIEDNPLSVVNQVLRCLGCAEVVLI